MARHLNPNCNGLRRHAVALPIGQYLHLLIIKRSPFLLCSICASCYPYPKAHMIEAPVKLPASRNEGSYGSAVPGYDLLSFRPSIPSFSAASVSQNAMNAEGPWRHAANM